MTSGFCPQCNTIHSLPSDEAELHAQELITELDKNKSILSPILMDSEQAKWPLFYYNSKLYRRLGFDDWETKCQTDYLWGPARGKMFGVLVCRDSFGNKHILRAFSGQYNSLWEVPGWAPPLFDVDTFNRLSAPADAAIKRLDKKTAVLPKGCGEYISRTKKRKAISQKLMIDLHGIYEIHMFNIPFTSRLSDIFYKAEAKSNKKGIPTGTGDCCGPKLLNQAAQLCYTPISLIEFYYGRENRSQTKHHLHFYDNCLEKCSPILGSMLCGTDGKSRRTNILSTTTNQKKLEIIAEFDQYVLINKPSGLPTVPGTSAETQDSVSSRFLELFKASIDTELKQPIIHRLDMDTSGIIIVAKTAEAHRRFSILFQNRLMYKEYTALLTAAPAKPPGKIDMPLITKEDNPLVQISALSQEEHQKPNLRVSLKNAITEWHFASSEIQTRVIFIPQTGRTHQLRAHAAYALQAPIQGDRIYGSESKAGKLRLHASKLSFLDPFTGETMEFTSQPEW